MADGTLIQPTPSVWSATTQYAETIIKQPPQEYLWALEFFKAGEWPQGRKEIEEIFYAPSLATIDKIAAGAKPPRIKHGDGYSYKVYPQDAYKVDVELVLDNLIFARFDEITPSVEFGSDSVKKTWGTKLKEKLFAGAIANGGTPVQPAADTMDTWASSNDTRPPFSHNGKDFLPGHNHIESGAAADFGTTVESATARLGAIKSHLTEHGAKNIVCYFNSAEVPMLLAMATRANMPYPITKEVLDTGVVYQFFGIKWREDNNVPEGLMLFLDADKTPGKILYLDHPYTKNFVEEDENIHVYQFGVRSTFYIVEKTAGYLAHVA